ncbi:S-layer homology domain-containing protein [Paenibacillus sp. F411]|uniref:Ig-like domain-containing protein n=1 Tax=Paenibacillus sp. F411 TaxID=2820239 RepID=UPI001AAFDC2C|nr:Ig-like domain-containing protein [Paenibacillus sp. F411]MBO2944093.1 S-layer homology domain-containing protein [Paenibacillus sp. F411]
MVIVKKVAKLLLCISVLSGLMGSKTVHRAYADSSLSSTIVITDTTLSIGETTTVTITFSEKVIGFTEADLTVPNGTLSGLASSDGGIMWTATLTPSAGIEDATNVITLDNTGIADAAGNTGTGSTDSNNYAMDTLRPSAVIVIEDTALTVGKTSLVTITFSEAVTGLTSADLTVPNGTLSGLTSSDGGITWTATLTPNANIEDMTNIITLYNTGVVDEAGNSGSGSTDSNNYAIDTLRPSAEIVIEDTALTIGETTLVTITFSEAVIGFTEADLTVPNGTLSGLSSSDGGITWTATLTPSANIKDTTNVITLDNTGVADFAGNAGSGSTDSDNYVIDTVRPSAEIAIEDTALTIGETTLVTITFSEALIGFTEADLTVPNGTLSGLASSDGGIMWTATLTPSANVEDTTNVITLYNTGVADFAGNAGSGSTDSDNYVIDTVRPSAVIVIEDTALTIGETTLVTITFSEAVIGFTEADLTVPNGTLSGLASSDGGITWTATLTPQANVNVQDHSITLHNDGIADIAGNPGEGVTLSNTYSISTVPLPDNSSAESSWTPSTPVQISVTSTNGILSIPTGMSGVVGLDGEIFISVPAGAFTEDIRLSIQKIPETPNMLSSKQVLASPIFAIVNSVSKKPSKPVSLTLTFDRGSLKEDQTPAVFYYDEVNKAWSEVEGGTIQGNKISVSIDQFGKYAVLALDKSPGDIIEDPSKELILHDISNHWAEENVRQAIRTGIVSGYPDGNFKPNASVTRAEFLLMLMNIVNVKAAVMDRSFSDTAEIGEWAKQAVADALHAGIVTGYADGSFRPNANITRAEMAVMVARGLDLSGAENAAALFADHDSIPAWAVPAVTALKNLAVLKGTSGNTFSPTREATRAEAVTVLINVLNQLSIK